MSNVCSLPWCRKPITSRKRSKRFPSDRPSQLAWLDALDAGTWFSIPPETLCTGLVLCDGHFDSKGNVKRRYEAQAAAYSQANIKLEPNMSPEESDEDDGDQDQFGGEADSYDSDYQPESSKHKRKSSSDAKEVRVNIFRVKGNTSSKQKRKTETGGGGERSKRTRGGSSKRHVIQSDSDDNEVAEDNDEIDFNEECEASTSNAMLNSIDTDRLSELTNDAVERSVAKSGNQSGKRRSLTLMQKMEAIRMLDSGMKQAHVSRKMNLRKSTLWQILQNREKIETAFRTGAPLRKRIVRRGAFADINEAVYQWYEKVRTQNLFVNARVLLTMAENIANELGRTDFAPTPSWLTRFKERYNIRFTNTPAKPRVKAPPKLKKETAEGNQGDDGGEDDECEEVDDNTTGNEKITNEDEDAWLKKDWLRNTWLESRVKNQKTREPYSERDTFFAEELGILYRITPKQAWQFRSGKNVDTMMQNFSITEERLTVLLCCNADGSEKRKLLIAGPAYSGVPSNLPADYMTSLDPSNWITKTVFGRWINTWNTNLKSQNRKIILVSSSSPTHTFKSNFSNIKIINIPTRLLSLLHPVNFGVATNFKTRYRRLLVERLVNAGGGRSVNCLEAIFMLSTAWNELSPDLIRSAFLKAGYFSCSDIPNQPDDDFDCSSLISKAAELDLAVPISKYPFSDYVEIDNSLCAIECIVLGGSETTCTEDDLNLDDHLDNENETHHSVDSVPVQCNLTAVDAQNALENMRLYAMSRSSCPQEVHNALSTLESFLLGHS